GFGGTNFHAILQNYDPEPAAGPALKSWPSELFLVRGADAAAARGVIDQVKALYDANHYLRLTDIAYTLAYSSEEPVQFAVVASSWPDLLAKLDAAATGTAAPGVFPRTERPGKVAFLFSGQGSQRVHMARDLFVTFPELRKYLNDYPEYHNLLFPGGVFTDEAKQAQRDAVTDTRAAQPLLGFVDLAVAQLLESFGVQPDCLAGHSYGELPALAYAGVIDPDDLPELSRSRADAIMDAVGDDPGQMVAVPRDAETVADLLAGMDDVWSVNLNSPRQTVVGGSTEAIGRVISKLGEEGIRVRPLNVACAFHTPLLEGADAAFAKALRRRRFGKARLDVWSNTTAEPYPAAATAVKTRLAEHLVKPVRFAEQLQAMYADGVRVFVEAGPGGVLAGLARQNLGEDITAIQVDKESGDGVTTLLEALARYTATGRDINVERLFTGRTVRQLDLNNPSSLAQSRTAWMVDGLEALPAAQWRAQGDCHNERTQYTMEDLRRFAMKQAGEDPGILVQGSGSTAEDVVQAYLNNVRTVLDDQRDIMLGYLGYDTDGSRRRAALPVFDEEPTSEPSRDIVVAPSATPAAEAVEVVEVEDEEDEDTVLRELKDLTPEDVHDLVIEVVSEKTGYPPEMLGLDMDLEADLSIDSIKRLEIIGSLNQKVVLPDVEDMDMDENEAADVLEHMASIKTLRGIIEWLQEMVQRAQEEGIEELVAKNTHSSPIDKLELPPGVENEPIEMVRLVPEVHPYPLGEEHLDLDGKRFAVLGGSEALAEALTAVGATYVAVQVDSKPDPEEPWHGLVFVNHQESGATFTVLDLYTLLKAVDPANLEWLLIVDDVIGHVLTAPDLSALGKVEGFSGFLKALQMEYPDMRARVVDSRQPLAAEALPGLIVDELRDSQRFPAVAYDQGERVRLLPVLKPLPDEVDEADADSSLAMSLVEELDKDSVIVAFGGAQGISPTLLHRLAIERPCHLVLTGRTPRDPALVQEYADQVEENELKKRLISEGLTEPRVIEARAQLIRKTRQVEHAVLLLSETGASVTYENVDVRDHAALRAFLRGVKERHGRIDAVFHAAGILEDRLFRDKTRESFERVYLTKTSPLSVFAEELFDDLKALVLFSSVAASFGNRGQADYAAANSVFDSVSFALAERRVPVKVLAVAWGPWQGAGMVGSTLGNEMRRRGLDLIDLGEGSEFYFKELAEGHHPNVLAIAGRPTMVAAYIDYALN
ncbi:MAG: SDR family NAD(P)-dependent oxidoreductase, partial [Propionibacteriaceae bacterium]|nr:SDR family NAD(P)-dependent oxidoreductase [Propionibacteriaceae bacterium]